MTAMALSVIAGGVVSYILNPEARWWIIGVCVFILFLLWLLWRSVAKPLDMVEKGYGMLMSQDFNSRLLKVGEYHADRIAELFNRMSSELKNERLRLSEQEGFLKQLVGVSPMGVLVFDFDYRITLMNRAFRDMAALTGKEEDFEGMTLENMDSELVDAVRKVNPGETVTVRLSDTKIYRVSNLWFMESGFRRPFILAESLTEEVMRAERTAYEKVIRVISHEVNNTMGGVVSLLELLADTMDDAEMRNVIESGEERCRSLSDFIRNYADVVKVADPVLLKKEMNAEIVRISPFLRTLTGDDVELEVNLSQDQVNVKVDSVLWEQVMINIVKNAAESVRMKRESQPGLKGKVSVSVFKERAGAVVEIADNGTGISPETSKKLFTPFFSTKSNGQGIGLTLVNEILIRHDCRFSLRTDADGLTRFSIRFR